MKTHWWSFLVFFFGDKAKSVCYFKVWGWMLVGMGLESKENKKMCDFIIWGLNGFPITSHHGLDHAAKQYSDDFLFLKNRYDSCSTNEEAFILDPDSTVGNRIESLTQRTAVIEGKNKVLFTRISMGIFILKAHTHFLVMGLLGSEGIQMLTQKFWEKKGSMSSWGDALRWLKLMHPPRWPPVTEKQVLVLHPLEHETGPHPQFWTLAAE